MTIRTAVRRLADRDISLMMVATDDGAGDPYVRGGHTDGLFLLSTHAGDRMVDALVDIAIPAVALGAVVGRESVIPHAADRPRVRLRLSQIGVSSCPPVRRVDTRKG